MACTASLSAKVLQQLGCPNDSMYNAAQVHIIHNTVLLKMSSLLLDETCCLRVLDTCHIPAGPAGRTALSGTIASMSMLQQTPPWLNLMHSAGKPLTQSWLGVTGPTDWGSVTPWLGLAGRSYAATVYILQG
jgi:hypothetical protein